MKFTHLNQQQRYQIESRLNIGQSPDVIARALGVDRSTIYREIKRNTFHDRELPNYDGYYGTVAHDISR